MREVGVYKRSGASRHNAVSSKRGQGLPSQQTEPSAAAIDVVASFGDSVVSGVHLQPTRPRRGLRRVWEIARRAPPASAYRIASSSSADLHSLTVGENGFALVRSVRGRLVLRFDRDWKGWVRTQGRLLRLEELVDEGHASVCEGDAAAHFAIPADCSIDLQIGTLKLEIRASLPAPVVPARKAQLDSSLVRATVATAVMVLGGLLAIDRAVESRLFLSLRADVAANESRWVQITVVENDSQRHRPRSSASKPSLPHEPHLIAPTTSADAGRAPTMEPSANSRDEAMARARGMGIAGILAAMEVGPLEEIVEDIHFDISKENIESYGSLSPAELAQKEGGWGHGIRKIGPDSGDGKDRGTIKTGPYQRSNLEGAAAYEANALTRPHKKKAPPTSAAATALAGSELSYDVVRGRLGLRKSRFRRCFEQADQVPEQLVFSFNVASSGSVVDARVATSVDPLALACVQDTLESVQFPEREAVGLIPVVDFKLRL